MQSKIMLILLLIIVVTVLFGCTGANSVDNVDSESNEADLGDDNLVVDNAYSNTCTKGKVDELCTGECGQFIDLDKDTYCDRAQ